MQAPDLEGTPCDRGDSQYLTFLEARANFVTRRCTATLIIVYEIMPRASFDGNSAGALETNDPGQMLEARDRGPCS